MLKEMSITNALRIIVSILVILVAVILVSSTLSHAECNESGDYLICEDWDSGTPPTDPWPCEDGPTWHGWTPACYGNMPDNWCGAITTSPHHSSGHSVLLHKANGYKSVVDIAHDIAGNPTKVYIRFYLYIPSGETTNIGSFAHLLFVSSDASAECCLDFRRCGEYSSAGYVDCSDVLAKQQVLAIHSYNPEAWIANNQDMPVQDGGNRDYFVFNEHEDEWVLVEWMIDFANDKTALWINEIAHVTDYDMAWSFSSATKITFSGFTQNLEGEIHYYIDDVVVSTSYIGPRGGGSEDRLAPSVSGASPTPGATGVSVNSDIFFHVQDSGDGVKKDSIQLTVKDNGEEISGGTLQITGDSSDYAVVYDPPTDFGYDSVITVLVNAQDLHDPANVMDTYTYSFTTQSKPDTTPPVISEVSSESSTSSSVITWTTDEPATSRVEYGLTTAYGSLTSLDSNLVTSHYVTISNLNPDTTYHYRVSSQDASENEAISSDYTLTTQASGEETTVTLQQGADGYDGSVDSWISNDEPDTNFGALSRPHLQGYGGTYDRALFNFDLSLVPANATIINATFEVYIYETNSTYETVGLYKILTNWAEGSVTYNSPWASQGLQSGTDYESSPYHQKQITSTGFASFDITNLVQQWVNGSTNNGFILKCDTHTSGHYRWYSSERSNTNLRHKVTVTYTVGGDLGEPQGLIVIAP